MHDVHVVVHQMQQLGVMFHTYRPAALNSPNVLVLIALFYIE